MFVAAFWMWIGVLVICIYGYLSADHVGHMGEPGPGADIGGTGILLVGVVSFGVGIVLLIMELLKRRNRPRR